jgi:geranylgeranyl pyrophosphate synthase
LQPLAFDLLAQMPIAPPLIVQAIRDLAQAAGSLGMAGGQAIDLESVGKALTQQALQQMHVLKTVALLAASVSLGGLAGGANAQQRSALDAYSAAMGLAFQVIDDVLDYAGDASLLGKNLGDDLREGKPTMPLIYLLNEGTAAQKDMAACAIEQIEDCDEGFFNEVLNAVKTSGALEYTLSQAHLKAEQAKNCLTHFPDNANTQALYQICDYSLSRSF